MLLAGTSDWVNQRASIANLAEPLCGLYVRVTGEQLRNADGSSRQEEILRCFPGEPVELRLRIDASEQSIDVISLRGQTIGEIGGGDALLIAQQIQCGGRVPAVIQGIYGFSAGNRRVVLVLGGQGERLKQRQVKVIRPLLLRLGKAIGRM